MNRLIIEPSDFISEDLVLIHGPRAEHLLGICKLEAGDPIKVGVLNGPSGIGEVIETLTNALKIKFRTPPEDAEIKQHDINIILALPRPQMLKRILQKSATFGVKQLVLFRSERVEKSYFGSPVLNSEEIRKNLILGLEQGGRTRLPEVYIFRMQRDFSEWRGKYLTTNRFLLSLNSENTILDFPSQELSNASFLIGPEGGFVPREEQMFINEGFIPVKVSESILRVESAFDFILAQHSLTTMRRNANG